MALVNIPRLDLQHYTEGTAEQRTQFVKDIVKAFNETRLESCINPRAVHCGKSFL